MGLIGMATNRFRPGILPALVALAALALWGCAEDGSRMCGDGILSPGETCDDGNRADGDGCSQVCSIESETGIQPTIASIQQNVFTPRCFECHHQGGQAPHFDSAEISYSSLVDVTSFWCEGQDGTSALLVKPFYPDDSCLVMMVEGLSGAGGLVMPPSPMFPLNQEQNDAIREWIAQGAPS